MNTDAGGAHRLERAWLTRGLFAFTLLPLAWVFGTLTAVRKLLYRLGWLRAQKLDVPVIVVGNLIVGGAGKTPTVMAIVALLRRHGFTPGIVSRGHGRNDDGTLEVQLLTVKEMLKYDTASIDAKPGQQVEINFINEPSASWAIARGRSRT